MGDSDQIFQRESRQDQWARRDACNPGRAVSLAVGPNDGSLVPSRLVHRLAESYTDRHHQNRRKSHMTGDAVRVKNVDREHFQSLGTGFIVSSTGFRAESGAAVFSTGAPGKYPRAPMDAEPVTTFAFLET